MTYMDKLNANFEYYFALSFMMMEPFSCADKPTENTVG
jgi:hypothetical protein